MIRHMHDAYAAGPQSANLPDARKVFTQGSTAEQKGWAAARNEEYQTIFENDVWVQNHSKKHAKSALRFYH